MIDYSDISPAFRPNFEDSVILRGVLQHEATPQAILYFAEHCHRLTDYAYWFGLGTLWVSYTGFSELSLWRRLFSSNRPGRDECLMKPSELKALRSLPYKIRVGRAVRNGETDCLSYTLDPEAAKRFAANRDCKVIDVYEVQRRNVLALFLRRGESEVLVLDRDRLRLVSSVPVVRVSE